MSAICMSLAQALATGRVNAAEAALNSLIAAHLPGRKSVQDRIGVQDRMRDQADVAQAMLMKACDATMAKFKRAAFKPSSPSARTGSAANR